MGLRNLLLEIHFAHAFCETSGNYGGKGPCEYSPAPPGYGGKGKCSPACDISVCLKN